MKRGLNIYKRKDGRYEGRYSVEHNISGKKIYRSVYGKTYKEAEGKLIGLIAANAPTPRQSPLTVRELSTEWLNANKSRLKPSTYANYRTKLESHIFPKLGDIRYDKLTTAQINTFVSDTLKNGRIKNGGALSESYVRDIVIMLKTTGKYAVRTHILHNPYADIIIPKTAQKAICVMDRDEETKLTEHLDKKPNIAVTIALFTGLRLGEICALTWSDIDLTTKTIKVRKTVQRIRNFESDDTAKTELITTPPKSAMSSRDVPVTAALSEALRKLKTDENCYVLSGTTKVTDPRTVQNQFRQTLKQANLPSARFHSLRHFFATKCARTTGFDIVTLSEILGHKNAETTLKMYVHTSDERKRECMNLLNFS